MSAFANLMALSASQTAEQQSAVELAMRERQRKEAERRKAQEAREAREREMEKQRRLKLFEEQKKEEERKKREAELQKARELALKRKEEEQRDRLLYGPKKAAKMASGGQGSGARGTADGKSKGSPYDDGDGPIPLTREELRERKQKMEMQRIYGGSKRSLSHHGGTHRVGRRLPGGAVDITSPSHLASQSSSGDGLSVRERLAAMPNTLVKLNTVKRDTRTIDEILQDRAKEKKKVLEGDQAAQFDDWFGSKKKDDKSRPSSVGPGSGTDTPQRPSASSTPSQKKATSVHSKPALSSKSSIAFKPVPSSSQSRGSSSKLPDFSKSKTSASTSKPNVKASSAYDYDRDRSRDRERERERERDRDRQYSSSSSKQRDLSKKRPRSDSRSMSPVPYSSKKRGRSMVDDEDPSDVRAEIWKLFGKDRDRYVRQDVLSDDEDMEADARDVEKEEMKSYRLAQKEDQMALEEERRREEEKRRRKKMLAKSGKD